MRIHKSVSIPLCVAALLSQQAFTQQWQLQNTPTTNDLWGVHFISASVGVAVGNNGTIIHTTNGGTTWLTGTNPSIARLNDVQLLNANLGYAVNNERRSHVDAADE